MAGLHKQSNECSSSVNDGSFLDLLSNYQILKKDSVPQRQVTYLLEGKKAYWKINIQLHLHDISSKHFSTHIFRYTI